MFDILYFFLLGIFCLFAGRYYYNNAYEMYTNERDNANNWIRRKLVNLNKPTNLKFIGILLMLLGIVGTSLSLFRFVIKLF
ncbi:MAG: hypothetical protein DI622_13950 [Chryseobacterium sp.]|nr:MAG: hypothetical protein DI622_13950 [Chryseobacterium sp.]